MTTAYGRWVTSLAQTLQIQEEFLYPHTRVPLLKEGRGIVGTRGVSSTMPILVVFLHNIYKNRDTSIVQGTWSRVWIPYRLFLYTQRDRVIALFYSIQD